MRFTDNERCPHRAPNFATTSGTGQQYHRRPGPIIAPNFSRRRSAPSELLSQASAFTLTAEILDGCASSAANAFAQARRLALRLHEERGEEALLARNVALALVGITAQAHAAAELAAQIGGVEC